MLVFIDDAGDPGFKIERGSSKIFIISLVIFEDHLEAEKTSIAIKELRRELKVSDTFEFKFNKTNKIFRRKFLEQVCRYKFKVRSIVVNKSIIRSTHLKTHKENFYNYIIMQVFKNCGGRVKNARLKFDSRGEKVLRDELRTYLSTALDNKNKSIFKDLRFVNSRQNTLIQLADIVSGSIYCEYVKGDKQFLNYLKRYNKIEDIWDFE